MSQVNPTSETTFRDAVMQAPVAICLLKGTDLVIEMANARMLEIWGRTAEQAIGKRLFTAMPESSGQGFEEIFAGVYSTGQAYAASEVPASIHRDGRLQTIYVNFVFEPFRDKGGEVTGITIVATEVTGLVDSKKAVTESENRLRSLVESSPVAMALVRLPDFEVELCNDAMCGRIWQLDGKAIIGKKLMDLLAGVSTIGVVTHLQTVIQTGTTLRITDEEYSSGSGENKRTLHLNFEYSPLRDATGKITSILISAVDVSGLVEARNEIKNAAERMQLATEGTGIATWDMDLVSGRFVHSSGLALIFGRPENEQLSYEKLLSLFDPDDRASVVEPAYQQAMQTGFCDYEARVLLSDGTTRWIKIKGKVIFTEKKQPIRMLGTVMDMTERRNAEENSLKLAAIVQSSDDAIISKRLDGTIISWNDSAQRIFGYSAEEMIGQTIMRLIPEGRQNEEAEIIQRLKQGRHVDHFETKRLTKDGRLLDLSLTISPIRGHNGQVIGASKIARDVTAHKQAERIISENEERLKVILDASDLGTYELNMKTKELTYSDKYAQVFGQKGDQREPHAAFVDRLHKDDLHIRDEAYETALKTGFLDYQIRVHWADGSVHWIEAKGKMFFDAQGSPEKLIGTARDITDEKLSKQRLEESEQRFRSMANTAPVMIWLTDLDKKAVFLNKCWSDFTGIGSEEGLGGGWAQAVHPDDLPGTSAAFARAYETRSAYNRELRIRHRNGRYRWVQDHAVPRYDAGGNFTGFIGTSVDIEEQRNAKVILEKKVEERTADLVTANEQLLRTNHELEQFAYVSSHDLQEPLRKIMTFSEMLGAVISAEGRAKEYLDKINSSALRMSTLIKDLLNYSRLSKSDERFVKTDLSEVLRNIREDFEVLTFQKNATIESSDLPVIRAIPIQINQLFYNLISNSLKFTETEPRIQITALPVTHTELLEVPGVNPDEKYVHLVFQDNGIGFSEEHAEQIFIIFQRLNDKQRYSGTGIGLAICKKIVENHGGYIKASGQPGKGARFDIYLPV